MAKCRPQKIGPGSQKAHLALPAGMQIALVKSGCQRWRKTPVNYPHQHLSPPLCHTPMSQYPGILSRRTSYKVTHCRAFMSQTLRNMAILIKAHRQYLLAVAHIPIQHNIATQLVLRIKFIEQQIAFFMYGFLIEQNMGSDIYFTDQKMIITQQEKLR